MKQLAILCVMFTCENLSNRLIQNLPVPITNQVLQPMVHADLELSLNGFTLMFDKVPGTVKHRFTFVHICALKVKFMTCFSRTH